MTEAERTMNDFRPLWVTDVLDERIAELEGA